MEEAGVPGEKHRPLAAASRVLPFCNLQIQAWTHAVLVIGLYELLDSTTNLIEQPGPCYYQRCVHVSVFICNVWILYNYVITNCLLSCDVLLMLIGSRQYTVLFPLKYWIELKSLMFVFFAMHFLLYLWMLNYSYKIFFVISYPFKFQLYIYIYRGCWYKHIVLA